MTKKNRKQVALIAIVCMLTIVFYAENAMPQGTLHKHVFEKEFRAASAVGRGVNFNANANDYYETFLQSLGENGLCRISIKSKSISLARLDMQVVFEGGTTYHFSAFNYPYYFKLISATQSEDTIKRLVESRSLMRRISPGPSRPKKAFIENLARKIDLYPDERFTKQLLLWHQDAWETLKNVDNQTLRDDFDLYVPLQFLVELENIGILRASAAPSVTLNRNHVLSLRALQKRQEGKVLSSTQRPPIVEPRPLGTPIFKSSLGFDAKTGDITVTLFHEVPDPSTASSVRVNLDQSFGYKEDKRNFFAAFTAKSPRTDEIRAEQDFPPSTPGEFRIFDLEDNESVGKECKIWEIAIWPQLVETLKTNRTERFTIRYPVRVELLGVFDGVPLNDEGFSIVPHAETAELTIDYRTMFQMEKLREASE